MCGSQNYDSLRATRVFCGATMGAVASFVFVFRLEKFLPRNGAKWHLWRMAVGEGTYFEKR